MPIIPVTGDKKDFNSLPTSFDARLKKALRENKNMVDSWEIRDSKGTMLAAGMFKSAKDFGEMEKRLTVFGKIGLSTKKGFEIRDIPLLEDEQERVYSVQVSGSKESEGDLAAVLLSGAPQLDSIGHMVNFLLQNLSGRLRFNFTLSPYLNQASLMLVKTMQKCRTSADYSYFLKIHEYIGISIKGMEKPIDRIEADLLYIAGKNEMLK